MADEINTEQTALDLGIEGTNGQITVHATSKEILKSLNDAHIKAGDGKTEATIGKIAEALRKSHIEITTVKLHAVDGEVTVPNASLKKIDGILAREHIDGSQHTNANIEQITKALQKNGINQLKVVDSGPTPIHTAQDKGDEKEPAAKR